MRGFMAHFFILFCVIIDPVWASVNLGVMLCINCSGEYLVLFHCIYACI